MKRLKMTAMLFIAIGLLTASPVAAKTHKHVYSVKKGTTAPTCKAKGYTLYKCKSCSATTKKNYKNKVACSGSWNSIGNLIYASSSKYGNYLGDGYCRLKVCRWCGRVLEKTKHHFGPLQIKTTYNDTVNRKKYAKVVEKTKKCSLCRTKYVESTGYKKTGKAYIKADASYEYIFY